MTDPRFNLFSKTLVLSASCNLSDEDSERINQQLQEKCNQALRDALASVLKTIPVPDSAQLEVRIFD